MEIRVTECPKLEGTQRGSPSPTPGPAQDTPNSPPHVPESRVQAQGVILGVAPVLILLRGTKTSPCVAELIPPWTGAGTGALGPQPKAWKALQVFQEMSGADLCVLPSGR